MVSAVSLHRGERCSGCGTAGWEWEDDPFAYQPTLVGCRGCMLKEQLADDDTPKPKGTTIQLIPKATAERLTLQAERDAEAGVSRRPIRRRNRA